MFKRRRNKKTDYKQRLALLKSGSSRVVVRRSLRYLHVQIVTYDEKGDKVVLEDTSKSLRKYGWLGNTGNITAAYLTGLLVGLKARKIGIGDAVLDIGLQMSVKGSSLYAVAAGVKDAGISIPVGKDILPGEDKISGKHISNYATILKKENSEKYKKQFSSYIKAGMEPEKITENFSAVKKRIADEVGKEPKVKMTVGNEQQT